MRYFLFSRSGNISLNICIYLVTGDSKELVRERCQLLLATLMEVGVLSPQQLFDRLVPAFSHRNSNVRDEAMKCLVATLNQ